MRGWRWEENGGVEERWGILQTTYIIWIICSESSLTVVLLGILQLDVLATGKGPALKITQLTLLTFKISELHRSSPSPCEPLSNILLVF